MPPQQAQQPSSNGGGLDSLVADPQFQSLQPSDQRKALAGVSGDDAFGKLSDEDTGSYVKAHQAILSQNTTNNTLAKTSGISAQPKPFTMPWVKQGLWRAAASTADVLPAIGGTVGGMIGATAGGGPASVPGAIGGAGMGGAGGAAGQQIIRRMLGFQDVPQTSGEAAQGITKEGATQAVMQGASELLPFLGGKLKNAAESQYERALAPTTKQNKVIAKDIAPQLIQRGEAGSLESLEKKAGQKIAQIKPALNAQYSGTPVPGAGTKVISDLEDLKQTYMPGGNVAQPQAVNAISGIQDIVKQYGPDIPQDHLRRLRQIFEEAPAQSGAYLGADLSTKYTLNAQQQAADSIRGILNKNPNLSALNKEISFWLDVQRVTRDSGLRRTGQEGGLMKVLSPLAGALAGGAGFLEKGPQVGVEAAVGTTLAGYAVQAMRSPMWRTASAVLKDRFSNALARGDVKAVTGLLGRFGVSVAESQTASQQPIPAPPAQ